MPKRREKKARRLSVVSNLLGNSINTQFNLLSHLPNMGQEVKLEIGSPTKHQWIDTTLHLINSKALLPFYTLCSRCALNNSTHTYTYNNSQHKRRGCRVSPDVIQDPIN